jgi:hypothetical protein
MTAAAETARRRASRLLQRSIDLAMTFVERRQGLAERKLGVLPTWPHDISLSTRPLA